MVLLDQGRRDAPVVCDVAIRTISVTAFSYFRCRKEFGELKSDQGKRRIWRKRTGGYGRLPRETCEPSRRRRLHLQRSLCPGTSLIMDLCAEMS